MKLKVIVLIGIALILLSQVMPLKNKLEAFVDEYQVIATNSFPCSANPAGNAVGGSKAKKGCYYKELGGCAYIAEKEDITECPEAVKDFIGDNQQSEPQAVNENIFEFIYDAMKNNTRSEECADSKRQACPIEFFERLGVMTDQEISNYMSIISSRPCSVGASCLAPDNIAKYITASMSKAKLDKITCDEASVKLDEKRNQTSKKLYSRIFPQCNFVMQD